MTTQSPVPQRIVIVGGGFGGVKTALLLSKSPHFQVQLVSENDCFSYYPQLYHTATGGSKLGSSIPLSELFKDNSAVQIVIGKVDNIDPGAKTIWTQSGQSLPYDSLVLALGSVTNYFGIAGMEEFSYGMKTLAEANELKHHLHETLVDSHQPDHHYVVIGAGPTGVEMAGALATYVAAIMKRHGITSTDYQIDLVEAAPRILPRSSEAYAARVLRRLQRLGVKAYTGKAVKAASADELTLDGMSLASHTVIWTAGVANNPLYAKLAGIFTLAKNHKVPVNQYLEAAPDLYVIGDNADTPYAGLALTAINDAIYLADQLMRKAKSQKPNPYRAKAPMTVIPVGHGWAAFNYQSLNIYGYPGWILRRLADLVAYHDIEGLVPATKVWLTDAKEENDCPVCDLPKKALGASTS